MKHALVVLTLVALSGGPSSVRAADEQVSPPGTFCWKMHYAGVVLGLTKDAQIVRLLGSGAHRPREGHGSVRYYVDPQRKASLRIATFTDGIVGEVTLSEGLPYSLSATERGRTKSQYFSLSEGFGNWHALNLGSTKQDVLSNLGEPASREGADSWVYNAHCTCELPEYLTIQFNSERVVRVVFSAPPG
jgi:outer membrane protein assembly factor BamE (lipoprotein component of BamABCDE complex)